MDTSSEKQELNGDQRFIKNEPMESVSVEGLSFNESEESKNLETFEGGEKITKIIPDTEANLTLSEGIKSEELEFMKSELSELEEETVFKQLEVDTSVIKSEDSLMVGSVKHLKKMESYNLISLIGTVKTEYDAVVFLQNCNIIASEKLCENGHNMKIKLLQNVFYWTCYKKGCQTRFSVKRNTWLERSKIPLRTIILLIYSWCNELSTLKFCAENFQISNTTTIDFNNFLREVCASSIMKTDHSIGGEDRTVEVDEMCFPKRKNNAGHILPPQWIFGGVCRETKDIFLCSIPDRKEETLIECIKKKIKPHTTIISDCFASYQNIDKIQDFHFIHKSVDPQSGVYTKNIENRWALLKYKNKKNCGTHRSMLNSYLCEFMWRMKHHDKNLFVCILNDISNFSNNY